MKLIFVEMLAFQIFKNFFLLPPTFVSSLLSQALRRPGLLLFTELMWSWRVETCPGPARQLSSYSRSGWVGQHLSMSLEIWLCYFYWILQADMTCEMGTSLFNYFSILNDWKCFTIKANYQVSKHFWPGAKSGKSEKQTNLTKSLEIWQHLLIKDLEVLTWFFFFCKIIVI